MLKSLQARLQQYLNMNFQMFKLDSEKAEEPEIKLSTSVGSSKKQENSRKTSTSASLTMLKPDCVNHNKLWKILQEMGIPDHLICLRNLYASQEPTVRTRQEQQTGYILEKEYVKTVYCHLAYLTYLYAEYIM